MITEETRQQIIFHLWENIGTSQKPISYTSVSRELDIPIQTVIQVIIKERLRKEIKNHNNNLIYKRLRTFK